MISDVIHRSKTEVPRPLESGSIGKSGDEAEQRLACAASPFSQLEKGTGPAECPSDPGHAG